SSDCSCMRLRNAYAKWRAGSPNTARMANFEQFIRLKNEYRNFDTKHALRRMQFFRSLVSAMSASGRKFALDLLGSINFGIVEENSDADVILYYFCPTHLDVDCPQDCPRSAENISYFLKLVQD